jgi:PAS domain S-box-containing protein
MFAVLNEGQIHLRSLFRDNDFESIAKKIADGDQGLLSMDDVNGKYFEVSAVRYRQETSDQIILLISDVTERRLKDKRIEDVIESLPQISWTANPQGEITFFSRGWYEYTSLSPSQALGRQWISIIHADDIRQVLSRWNESVKHGKKYQQAARFKRFDGQYRWHLSRSVPIFAANREIILWVGTSTDIHEHVLLTETLERKVHERTKRLEEKNAELEQFAYISSHDLQEPLRKIQTFAHILKDDDADLPKEAKDRYIDKIIATSARMSKLIRDLLNFTKIDQLEEEEVLDLNNIMHQIVEDLELAIHQNSALVEVAQLPVIKGRPLQIKQLFYNIINNGLKFRKPDIAPRISVSSKKLSKKELGKFPHVSPDREYHEIVVADNGIGFEQKYADQIFTVFQRLHSKSAYEGTGIGLSIARKVATNHGGHIFAVSSPGQGSEFHILLPAIADSSF